MQMTSTTMYDTFVHLLHILLCGLLLVHSYCWTSSQEVFMAMFSIHCQLVYLFSAHYYYHFSLHTALV